MTRRTVLLALSAAGLRADSATDAWDTVSAAAAALAQSNGSAFLACFDPKMAGYESLRNHTPPLLLQAEVVSSIDQLENQGDEQKRKLELDWLIRLKPRSGIAPSVQREERVKCVVTKQGRKWRITAFEPLALFAPM
jgi:hypothetical protein